MSKHYKEAIDVLAWEKLNPMVVLRQIAKDSPAALVHAARLNGYSTAVTLESRVRDLLRSDDGTQTKSGYIDAIKLVRNERGLPLKEAKDYVDALR